MQAVGTIGAVIMPHNLYLHSGLVLSRKVRCKRPWPHATEAVATRNRGCHPTRKVRRSSPRAVNDAIWYNTIESALALCVSFVINLAVVATNYSNFYSPACAEAERGVDM